MTQTFKNTAAMLLAGAMLIVSSSFLSPSASANEDSNHVSCAPLGGIVTSNDWPIPDCAEDQDHLYD